MVMVMVMVMVVVMRKVMEDDWRLSFTKLKQPTSKGSPENSDDNGLTSIRQVLKRKKEQIPDIVFVFIHPENQLPTKKYVGLMIRWKLYDQMKCEKILKYVELQSFEAKCLKSK